MSKGKVEITLTAKDDASAKLKAVGNQGQSLADTFKGIAATAAAMAAAVTAAVGKMLSDWAAAGDDIAKMAERTGWAVEELSALAYIAKMSGSDLTTVEAASKKLSKAIIDASDGMQTYVREFQRLGLSVDDLLKMSPEQQFWTVAEAVAALGDAALRSSTAQELFGRSGTDLLPILANGSTGVAELRERFKTLAYQWTDESVQAAAAFQDAFEELGTAMDSVKFTLVEELGPEITRLINEQILPGIVSFREFIQENADLKDAFVSITSTVQQLVAAIAELYDWYKRIGDAIPDWLQPTVEAFDLGNIMTGKNVLGAYQDYLGEVSKLYAPQRNAELAAGIVPQATGGDVTLVVNGPLIADDASMRQLWQMLESYAGESMRRTSFPHINTSGYYPGSSAK